MELHTVTDLLQRLHILRAYPSSRPSVETLHVPHVSAPAPPPPASQRVYAPPRISLPDYPSHFKKKDICVICAIYVTIYTWYPPKTRYAMINNAIISKTKRPSVLQKQVSKKLAIYNNRRCCFYSISIGRVTLTNRVFQI